MTGCSDDENHRYDGWRDVSTAAITVLSLIAVLIWLGTILDTFERNRTMSMGAINVKEVSKGLGFKLLTSFSLVSNMEVIFQEPEKKGGNRLDCLDGIRAISMNWVILGHNFSAGRGYLHGRNKEYLDSILRDNAAGVAFMPVKEDYSVDTFIFIGAVLLSYLLLKDLDKSNGWFHPKGIVRMIFFYLNRYLRLSIPYGLIIMIFAGIVPLIVTEPMSARTSAYNEAEECRKY